MAAKEMPMLGDFFKFGSDVKAEATLERFLNIDGEDAARDFYIEVCSSNPAIPFGMQAAIDAAPRSIEGETMCGEMLGDNGTALVCSALVEAAADLRAIIDAREVALNYSDTEEWEEKADCSLADISSEKASEMYEKWLGRAFLSFSQVNKNIRNVGYGDISSRSEKASVLRDSVSYRFDLALSGIVCVCSWEGERTRVATRSASLVSMYWWLVANGGHNRKYRIQKCRACGRLLFVTGERGHKRTTCDDYCRKWANSHPGEKYDRKPRRKRLGM